MLLTIPATKNYQRLMTKAHIVGQKNKPDLRPERGQLGSVVFKVA